MNCSHYWQVVKHKNWMRKHTLIQCIHCEVFSVTHFGQLGPCEHVVGRDQKSAEEEAPPEKRDTINLYGEEEEMYKPPPAGKYGEQYDCPECGCCTGFGKPGPCPDPECVSHADKVSSITR